MNFPMTPTLHALTQPLNRNEKKYWNLSHLDLRLCGLLHSALQSMHTCVKPKLTNKVK